VRASRISIALAALLSCAAASAHLVVTVSGDPAETVREAQERAAEEPDWPEVGADLVRAYVAAGRPDEALAELDRIVKLPGLAGDKTHVRMAGAEILLARGDLDAAIAELRAAAEGATMARPASEAWLRLADILRYEKRQGWYEAYRAAAEVGLADGRRSLVNQALRAHGKAELIAACARELEIDHDPSWGDRIVVLEAGRRTCGNDPILLYLLGEAYLMCGQTPQATDIARQGIAAEKGRWWNHLLLGQCLEAGGAIDEAVAEYQQAAKEAEQYADAAGDAHAHLAAIYLKRGDRSAAYPEYRQAVYGSIEGFGWDPWELARLAIDTNNAADAADLVDQAMTGHPEASELMRFGHHGPDIVLAALRGVAGDYPAMRAALSPRPAAAAQPGDETVAAMLGEGLEQMWDGPDAAIAYSLVGLLFRGQEGGGVGWLEKAIAESPDAALPKWYVAISAARVDPDRALTLAREVLQVAKPGGALAAAAERLIERGGRPRGQ